MMIGMTCADAVLVERRALAPMGTLAANGLKLRHLPSVILSGAKDLKMRKRPILRPFVVFATQGDGMNERREILN